ncbi:hypothetical protein PVL29_003242 [Vitis rotundifolia]|uniref:Transmembrane protein n=1 Tax=Vitis rotundifolia TaxID=103349 RepID=A0AA39E4T6_VITRO|nr:hypothetical protein PVL29_003242 [Vitis rotundifolia]
MVVDEGNASHCHLQWAKILVRSYRRKVPRILHVVVRSIVFAIQLWWEISLWLMMVGPNGSCKVKVRDEWEVWPCFDGSVGSKEVKSVLEGKRVLQEEHLWLAKGVVGLAFST